MLGPMIYETWQNDKMPNRKLRYLKIGRFCKYYIPGYCIQLKIMRK